MKKRRRNYYNWSYFQQRDYLILPVALMISHLLDKEGAKNILEVGCGTGRVVQFLKLAGFNAIGCDKSKIACRFSGQIQASAAALPFKDGRFDAVLSIALIEHLTPEEGLKSAAEAYRVLKPGGVFFLITPNFWSPNRLIKGKHWFAHVDPTHTTYYTPVSLYRLLKRSGFYRIRYSFEVSQDPRFECPFFNLANKGWPKMMADAVSYLFYSTPLGLIRENIWMSATK